MFTYTDVVGLQVFQRDVTPSRETFLSTLYNFAVFNISSLRLGPYGAACSDSTSCNCNQGMRQVWIGQAGTTGYTSNVPSSTYNFTSCGVSYSTGTLSSFFSLLRSPPPQMVRFAFVLC